MAKNSPFDLLREKLAFFQKELAITADAAQRFELSRRIREIEEQIADQQLGRFSEKLADEDTVLRRHAVHWKGLLGSPMSWIATRSFGVTGLALLLLASALAGWFWDRRGRTEAEGLANELNRQNDAYGHRRLVDEKLTRYRRWTIPELHRRVRQKPTDESSDSQRVVAGQHRADEAIALLRLGALNETRAVFAWRTHGDPEAQTQFVDRAKDRGVTIDELVQLYVDGASTRDDSSRFAVLLTLGTFPDEVVDASRRQQIADQLKLSAVFRDDPSSGIHASVGWLLRTWRLATPDLESLEPSDAGPNWFVKQFATNQTRDEMTFIRVPKGEFVRRDQTPSAVDQRVELTCEFWLSDREVSVGLFHQFVESVGGTGSEYRKLCQTGEIPEDWKWNGEDTEISPTASHPVQNVDWIDAVRFCNWLSRRDQRQPCYVASPMDDWTLAPDANGYRLPREAEWEYACRAGTMTTFSCGGDEAALKRYAVYQAQSAKQGGARMPNPWGLFDMHGNVWEWCQDWYGHYESAVRVVDPIGRWIGSDRVGRGGSWYDSAGHCRSAIRSTSGPSFRSDGLGFRVALSSTSRVSSQVSAKPAGE